jgi:hypothetical protein
VDGATPAKIEAWMSSPRPELTAALDRTRAALEGIVEPPTRKRRKMRRNLDDGAHMDEQAWFERRSSPWTDARSVRSPKPTVTVAVNTYCYAMLTTEHLMYRGAAAAVVADVLTQLGHSVELTAYVTVADVGPGVDRLMYRVPVKSAGAPLDVAAASVALSEIGFFRIALVPLMSRLIPSGAYGSFGRAADGLTEDERRGFDIVIDQNVRSMDSAVAAVRAAVAKFEK